MTSVNVLSKDHLNKKAQICLDPRLDQDQQWTI